MSLCTRGSSVGSLWLLVLLVYSMIVCTGAGDVTIRTTLFENLPTKLFYFEDSGVILYLDSTAKTVFRSENEGGDWSKVANIPDNTAVDMYSHPYDKKTAFILTESTTHYITQDRGNSWTAFHTPLQPSWGNQIFGFHAERSRYILFTGVRCSHDEYQRTQTCTDEVYYTRDAFATEPSLLKKNVVKCIWGRSTPSFQNVPEQMTICLEYINSSSAVGGRNLRLVQSEDYFQSSSVVQFNEEAKGMGGVVGLSIIDKFMVAALKHKDSDDMSLFVTEDAVEWDMANIPIPEGLKQNAYTLLESSSHALVIDVVTSSSSAYGNMYISNSNGSFYTESLKYTNRNHRGIVDYEKVQGVEGIVLSNIVTNWKDVDRGHEYAEKKLQTKISFDNGGSWRYLKPPRSDSQGKAYKCTGDSTPGNCNLHLHSVSRPHNLGRVYSSIGAPGILMGVGNVGTSLLAYEQCDTFLSDDGGLTWTEVIKGAHKYEMGDTGSLLVLVDDESFTNKVLYSPDRGRTWNEQSLDIDIRANMLTTDPESTTSSFLLLGLISKKHTTEHGYAMIQLDFDHLMPRKCEFEKGGASKDFEIWTARNLEDGSGCIMGHTTAFWRRKADAECYVGEKFKDPDLITKNCPCGEEDFECDYNFVRNDDGVCTLVGPEIIPRGQCKSVGDRYLASSGYRKIAGNTCDEEKGKKLDEPVEKECPSDGASDKFPTGKIVHHTFISSAFVDGFFYFHNSTVVLMHTADHEVWRSSDEGATWSKLSSQQLNILYIIMHEWDSYRAYFFTSDGKMLATTDRGETLREIPLPLPPNSLDLPLLDFHPDELDWLLFTGSNECPNCHSEVFLSKNHGRSWELVETFAHKCIFGRSPKFASISKESIFCSSFKNKDAENDQMALERIESATNPLQLVFIVGKSRKVVLEPVLEYAMLEEFLIVATQHDKDLTLQVSLDGERFSEAVFPPNTRVQKNAFTALQSNTGSIFLDIFQSTARDIEFGTLYVSNSNGTYFNQVLKNTNRDSYGVVDFEKMKGIDGIILANEVINADTLGSRYNSKKKIRTVISMDDGRSWKPLQPPKVDATNNPIECLHPEECYLNLHSKTDVFSESVFGAPSAAGLMMGVGNVGPYLLPYEQGNTYITRDGGRTWKEIRRGQSLYEFGDSGGILVVVDDERLTNQLLYSWNYGENWETYIFSDEMIRVSRITTEPKSTSLKFLISGITPNTSQRNSQQVVISIDFSTLEPRQCIFDESDMGKNDFELWNPGGEAKCLLGQETEYWRRKADRVCYIGDVFGEPRVQQTNCECTELDYQCDFNFWRNSKGECELYGVDPKRPHDCPAEKTYQGSSGYTKIPTSRCEGGLQKETEVTKECSDLAQVRSIVHVFDSNVVDYNYFKKSDHVLMRTEDGKVLLSYDEGYAWDELTKELNDPVNDIYMHPYSEDEAYFITKGSVHYYTVDEGRTIETFETPAPPNKMSFPVLSFHPGHTDWLIYLGERNCDSIISLNCYSEAFYSHDRGVTWKSLHKNVRSCVWGNTDKFSKSPESRIFCELLPESTNSRSTISLANLASSDDYFKNSRMLLQNSLGFAIFEEFMIASQVNADETGMLLQVSVDGEMFALAQFPGDSSSIHPAYTILESNTHSVFLHVSTGVKKGFEYGTIFNSNANGTYFTTSIENVNRDGRGLVDFEKMAGIDGVAMVNQVINPKEEINGGKKKTRSLITHDNGRTWKTLTPPEVDFNGAKYKCQEGEECSLHIHSYTERQDPQNIFSSSSAVGLMMAVGNVGGHLSEYTDGDTFLSRDAGKTWKEIRKEAHMYEFGDHGAILLIANDEEPTDHISYSLDEGNTFKDYRFTESNRKVRLSTIAIEPQSTSRKFLLFGKTDGFFSKQVVAQIDFNGLNMDKCIIDTEKDGDFELWDPAEGQCLFGREVQYYRRLPNKTCFVEDKFQNPPRIIKNCTCTEADFECDYNFVRSNGKCVLVDGASPLSTSCSGRAKYYQVSSGYRKMPISSCEGGVDLAKPIEHRCPNSGLSGGAITALVLIPLLCVLCILFVLFRRYRTVPITRLVGRYFAQFHLPNFHLPHIPIPSFVSTLLTRVPFLGHRRSGYTQVQSEEPFDVLLDDYDSDDDMDV